MSFATREERDKAIVDYVIETKTTVRKTAAKFGISKSTVHHVLTNANNPKVSRILAKNKAERHIRGGMATKKKYEHSIG